MGIKSWWNSLFQEPNLSTSGLPKVNSDTPIPKVKPPKTEKDISEPVLSFIEVYKANPKRFKLSIFYSEQPNEYGSKDLIGFQLRDLVANKKFSLSQEYAGYTIRKSSERGMEDEYVEYYNYRPIQNTLWMTAEERKLVFETIKAERLERGNNLLVRKKKLQRERLTKLYKGE